jgi:predicted ABC-type ATPase
MIWAECPRFINADMIAAGLSPYRPETMAIRAGRLFLEQIHRYVRQGLGFAFETTLSGKLYARLIPQWRGMGYCVELLYLQLPSPEMAVLRVRSRVREGGHAVPEDVIRRRFDAGLRNLHRV